MHLTIWKKLAMGFSILVILIALVGLSSWRYTSVLSAEVDTIYENNLKAAVHLANAQDALWRLRYGFPQYLVLTGAEDRKKITDEEPKLYALINEQIAAYARGERSPEEREAIKKWEDVSQKYFAARPKWFELVAADKMTEAAEWRAATTTPFGGGSVKALGTLIELQRKVADEKHKSAQATAARATVVTVTLVGIAMLMGAVISIVVSRSVTGPLLTMVGRLADMEQRNDLTERIDMDRADEIGQVSRSIDTFVAKLEDLVIQVKDAAGHAATAAGRMSTATEELSSGAQTQASSLEETAASLEEITGTVKQNADNARLANQLAVASRDVADKGGHVVAEAVEAMSEINRSSKKIADIITTIDEIAFQTNLLALNAAVEAARAGEQGRGFAVVAAEVRNLAQRSATAAKEIKALIQDSVQKVEDGSALVNKSGATLSEIVGAVKRVTEIIAEIAAASNEQTTGIDQVNKAVAQMDTVTQANAAQTDELSSTAQSLAAQAQQLQGLVARFKLDDERSRGARASRAATPAPRPAATPDVREVKLQAFTGAPRPKAKSVEPPVPAAHNGNGHSANGRSAAQDGFEEF